MLYEIPCSSLLLPFFTSTVLLRVSLWSGDHQNATMTVTVEGRWRKCQIHLHFLLMISYETSTILYLSLHRMIPLKPSSNLDRETHWPLQLQCYTTHVIGIGYISFKQISSALATTSSVFHCIRYKYSTRFSQPKYHDPRWKSVTSSLKPKIY